MLPILLTISAFILSIGYVAVTMFDESGELKLLYLMIVTFVGVFVAALFGSKCYHWSILTLFNNQ